MSLKVIENITNKIPELFFLATLPLMEILRLLQVQDQHLYNPESKIPLKFCALGAPLSSLAPS